MLPWNEMNALFIMLLWLCMERSQALRVDEYTDVCMDGRHHKSKPGPEASLFHMCSPWTKRSCCTSETSKQLHLSDNWLNFNWNHCGWLSARCREQFVQDLCFYECSPNVGPWLVDVTMKIRNETMKNVPLCQSVCTNWWNDCKDDFTCRADWSKGFNWTTGINKCPDGSECKPFHQIYSDANSFCEQVWGQSWKVVPDSEPCMYLWFDADQGNPNDKVALLKARQLVSGSELTIYSCFLQIFMFFTASFYMDFNKI